MVAKVVKPETRLDKALRVSSKVTGSPVLIFLNNQRKNWKYLTEFPFNRPSERYKEFRDE